MQKMHSLLSKAKRNVEDLVRALVLDIPQRMESLVLNGCRILSRLFARTNRTLAKKIMNEIAKVGLLNENVGVLSYNERISSLVLCQLPNYAIRNKK